MIKRISLFLIILTLTASCSTIKNSNYKELNPEFTWIKNTLETPRELVAHGTHLARPLIYKDLIIQANGSDGLSAYRTSNGNLAWRFYVKNGIAAQPTIYDDKLYFGGNDGNFYALDASTRRILWTFPSRTETLGSALVTNNGVYFITSKQIVYALDTVTGKQKWTYRRTVGSISSIRGAPQPLFYNNQVIVGFSDGSLVSLKSSNGSVNWERALGSQGRFKGINSTPVLEGNRIFATSFSGGLYSIDANTGKVIWNIEFGSSSSPLIHEDKIYYSTDDGHVISAFKNSGKVIWKYSIGDRVGTEPAIHKGLLMVNPSQGPLLILDSEKGQLITTYTHSRGGIAPLAVNSKSNHVAYITTEGVLHYVRLQWINPTHKWPWELN